MATNDNSQTDARVRMLPYIVAATFFMEYLDTTIIATALPQMAQSFGVGPNELSLGMTAYMLTLAVFIPISGWVADRFGSRTVFGMAIAIFTLASILCGFSQNVWEFTAARVLQGLGGGGLGGVFSGRARAEVRHPPWSSALRRFPFPWTIPYPQAAVPGSMPMTLTTRG